MRLKRGFVPYESVNHVRYGPVFVHACIIGASHRQCSHRDIITIIHPHFVAVLRAIGVEEDLAHTSIRFGLGRFTTEVRIACAAATFQRLQHPCPTMRCDKLLLFLIITFLVSSSRVDVACCRRRWTWRSTCASATSRGSGK